MQENGRASSLPALAKIREKPIRVAAFCRIAAGACISRQQWRHYSAMVGLYPNWIFAGCYGGQKDIEKTEQCAGGFPQMLAACKAGEIDLIITKSLCTLKRNTIDCLNLLRNLQRLSPPVGVYFEDTDFYSICDHSDVYLSFLLLSAEIENENRVKHIRHIDLHDVNILERARKIKGLTQQNVADKANISVRHYRMLENKYRDLGTASFRIVMAVCKELGIEPEKLLYPNSTISIG